MHIIENVLVRTGPFPRSSFWNSFFLLQTGRGGAYKQLVCMPLTFKTAPYFKVVSTVIPSFDGQPSAIIARKTDLALSSFASVVKLEYSALIGGERSLLCSKLLSPLSNFPRGAFSFKVLESCALINNSLGSAPNDGWVFLLGASLPSRDKV